MSTLCEFLLLWGGRCRPASHFPGQHVSSLPLSWAAFPRFFIGNELWMVRRRALWPEKIRILWLFFLKYLQQSNISSQLWGVGCHRINPVLWEDYRRCGTLFLVRLDLSWNHRALGLKENSSGPSSLQNELWTFKKHLSFLISEIFWYSSFGFRLISSHSFQYLPSLWLSIPRSDTLVLKQSKWYELFLLCVDLSVMELQGRWSTWLSHTPYRTMRRNEEN